MSLMKAFRALFLLALLGGVVYTYREPLERAALQVYAKVLPCGAPIPYRIGEIDERFGMTREEFLSALQSAEKIWEKPSGMDLFTYSNAGSAMPVNFVYDQRQATTEKLKVLDIAVDQSLASYNKLRVAYAALRDEYVERRTDFSLKTADFDAAQTAHAEEVRYWNSRGGAPEAEYHELQTQKAMLEAQLVTLKREEAALNAKAARVNEMVDALNTLARALNLDVTKYNTVGRTVPNEFEEGLYSESLGERQIEIYEFGSREKLIRVLAHEFGHALGLEAVHEEKSIKVPPNKGGQLKASAGDIAELRRRCGVE